MSDAWAELQALKSRKRRLEERKKERQDILNSGLVVPASISSLPLPTQHGHAAESKSSPSRDDVQKSDLEPSSITPDQNVEEYVLRCLTDVAVNLPLDSRQILDACNKTLLEPCTTTISHDQVVNLLEKFAVQQLISIKDRVLDDGIIIEVLSAEHTKLLAMTTTVPGTRKRKAEEALSEDTDESQTADDKKPKENDVLSLLSLASTREKENKRIGEEIRELLSRPSAKEKTLAEQFRSQGGTTVQEFCPHGTKSECRRAAPKNKPCGRLHFRKIIQSHTDETLGDCSFLNTCFHMETCKYVHYEVDTEKVVAPTSPTAKGSSATATSGAGTTATAILKTIPTLGKPTQTKSVLHPPQWIHCDLRFFDMTTLGKFSVIMADPPWDIHMELPYGTLSDDEMRHLNIPALQDEGLIFLWVTGRAMELGRECLQLWGYERVDELIWVKTNQLQRIIRTGRTGHWLNHGKEHCLVGMKGNPPVNRGLDCDVIVAEVRATSHKPDEVYGIIERLSPGTRKIELFGRRHNIQPNWMTLGNQLDGIHLVDEELRSRFFTRYPDGNCMKTV